MRNNANGNLGANADEIVPVSANGYFKSEILSAISAD